MSEAQLISIIKKLLNCNCLLKEGKWLNLKVLINTEVSLENCTGIYWLYTINCFTQVVNNKVSESTVFVKDGF